MGRSNAALIRPAAIALLPGQRGGTVYTGHMEIPLVLIWSVT